MLKRLIAISLAGFAGTALVSFAQQPAGSGPSTVASRDACPVESHPAAINPDLIACHARFAPLPEISPEFDKTDPQQLEHLRGQGDAFVRQLNRRDACGKDAKLQRFESCAILVYVLEEPFRQAGLPWTYIVKIYRMQIPGDGNLRNAVLLTVNSNDSEGMYGPGKNEVWQLLAEQRATTRCRHVGGQHVGTGISAAGMKPDQCRSTESGDVRYRPLLVIGKGEASRVLNKASIERNFAAPPFVVQCPPGSVKC